MYIINGIFKYNKIPNETVLHINISNDGKRELLQTLPEIISQYSKNISVIEFNGTEGDLNQLINALCFIHENKIKTCFETMCDCPDEINEKLLEHLDYVYSSSAKAVFYKEYSPFGDCEVWSRQEMNL